MLGGSFFRDFDEDPFFAGHRQHMQMMQQMMFQPGLHPMLEAPTQPRQQRDSSNRHHGNSRQAHQDVVPFGPMGMGMMGQDFGMGPMFTNMRQMMNNMQSSFNHIQMNPSSDGQTFSQSSFVSYSNTGQGQPQIYQASSSTRQAPGGVKETRRTVRDTSAGVEKMSVGHHINERAHIIERSCNRNTGEQNENTEFVNIDEEEAPTFDREWQEKTRHLARGMDITRGRHNPIGNSRNARRIQALPEPRDNLSRRAERE